MTENSSDGREESINFKTNDGVASSPNTFSALNDIAGEFKSGDMIMASGNLTNPVDRSDSMLNKPFEINISNTVAKPWTDMGFDVDSNGIASRAFTSTLNPSITLVDFTKPFGIESESVVVSDYITNPVDASASILGDTATMLYDDLVIHKPNSASIHFDTEDWKFNVGTDIHQTWNSDTFIEAEGIDISGTVAKSWNDMELDIDQNGIVYGALTSSFNPSSTLVDFTKPFGIESESVVVSDYITNPVGTSASIVGDTAIMLRDELTIHRLHSDDIFSNTGNWKINAGAGNHQVWNSDTFVETAGMNISDTVAKTWADVGLDVDQNGITSGALSSSFNSSNTLVDFTKPFCIKDGVIGASDHITNSVGSSASMLRDITNMLQDDFTIYKSNSASIHFDAEDCKINVGADIHQGWSSDTFIEAEGIDISGTVAKSWTDMGFDVDSNGIASRAFTSTLNPSITLVDFTKPFGIESESVVVSDYITNPVDASASILGDTATMLYDDLVIHKPNSASIHFDTEDWKFNVGADIHQTWNSDTFIEAEGIDISGTVAKSWNDFGFDDNILHSDVKPSLLNMNGLVMERSYQPDYFEPEIRKGTAKKLLREEVIQKLDDQFEGDVTNVEVFKESYWEGDTKVTNNYFMFVQKVEKVYVFENNDIGNNNRFGDEYLQLKKAENE